MTLNCLPLAVETDRRGEEEEWEGEKGVRGRRVRGVQPTPPKQKAVRLEFSRHLQSLFWLRFGE